MILMEPSLLRHYESANLAIERFVVKKTCVKKKKKNFLKLITQLIMGLSTHPYISKYPKKKKCLIKSSRSS